MDYGRRLTSPHEGFTLLGSADYDISEHVNAYTVINFANSVTETRREPAPTSGNFAVAIPFASDPNTKYLPSIAQSPTLGVNVGDTLPEFRVGGKRGTNCAPTGGCTMQQAFPVTAELRNLLNSRPNVTLNNAASPFNGQTVCELREVDSNAGNAGHTVQVPASGTTPAYTRCRWIPTRARPSRPAAPTLPGACRTSWVTCHPAARPTTRPPTRSLPASRAILA